MPQKRANSQQIKEVLTTLGHTLSPAQESLVYCNEREILGAGGERGGKSWVAAEYYNTRFWEGDLYWVAAKDYERCHAEFEYIIQAMKQLEVVDTDNIHTPKNAQWSMKLKTGTVIKSWSLQDWLKIGSEAPDGIIVCEVAQITLPEYNRLTDRTAEKRGWVVGTGCLTGDTLVATSGGLLTLKEIVGDGSHPVDLLVPSLVGDSQATLAYYNGKTDTVKLNLERGLSIEGTLNHKGICVTPQGSIDWVEFKDIDDNTLVGIRYGTNIFGTNKVSTDFAYLAGLYTAEGSWERDSGGLGRITFTLGASDDNTEVVSSRGFHPDKHYVHWRKHDSELCQAFLDLGINPDQKAKTKEVPLGIRKATKEVQIAYLQGLFDGDGTSTDRGISLCTSSHVLGHQVQMMLLNLGVFAQLHEGYYKCSYDGQKRYRCDVAIADNQQFVSIIGFRITRKQLSAKAKKSPSFFRNQAQWGTSLLGYPIVWVRVKSKEYSSNETYDLHVPVSHSYWANGLIVHNTFESSLGWYPEKWKLYQLPGQTGKSFSLPSWSNIKIYPGGEQDPEIVRLRNNYASNPDYFMERFGGVPCPPHGLVFPEVRYLIHVKELPLSEAPLYLWVDPGYAGAYAVEVVQIVNDTIYVVDEVYEQGLVTEQIIDVCLQKPWWKLVRGGTIDIAALQHQAMPAVAEVWQAKAKLHLTSNRVEEAPGRERLHTFLNVNPIDHQPRMFIDPKCKGILSEFGLCPNPFTGQAAPYKWKEDRAGVVIGQAPEDKNNHGIKAVIYGIIDNLGFVTRDNTGFDIIRPNKYGGR